MTLLIFQLIAIVLQLIAMVVATRLVRATKFNASWIFFNVAIVIITLQRIDEFFISLNDHFQLGLSLSIPHDIALWGGVVISVAIAGALLLIRKLISFIEFSERKRSAEQEKTLNAVIVAEENQRQLIAKELHDGLGPLLSTAQMSISAIRATDEKQKEIIANAENAIVLALKSLKSTSGSLSSHVLENFGLSRAISNIVKNIDPLKKVEIKFYTNLASRRFTAQHELVVYRVVSELLNNSLKHSKATKITLDVVWTGSQMEVVYSDNGCGFDPKAVTLGMGLGNISSRVESVKGNFELQSSPNGGTKVMISFKTKEVEG